MHNVRREICTLLEALIRFRTTESRPEERAACMMFMRSWCAANEINHECMLVNGIESLYVGPSDYTTDVLLLSHYDVVDGPDELFTPFSDENRLYGRGSLDDKYAIALTLLLYREYQRAFPGQKPPFMLLITGDEEVDGTNGASTLVQKLHPTCAFALDGGSPQDVMIRGKGILRVDLSAHGTNAHAAHPWMGVNALDMLFEDYASIKRLFAKQYDPDADHWMTTCTMSVVQVGNEVNKVPGTAHAKLDIRYITEEDPQELLTRLRETFKSTLNVVQIEPAFHPVPSQWIDRLISLIPDCQQGSMDGATDARFLSREGIPAAIWGAEGDESAHSDNEYVEIESLVFVWNTLKKMFGLA